MNKGKKPQTGREALRWAASFLEAMAMEQGQARLEARLLLAKAWNKAMVSLVTSLHEDLPGEVWQRFTGFVERRAAHEPLQYILGKQEFMSLSFMVTPAVLIPRGDTEVLVEEAIRLLQGRENPRIVDLGTGSGAIAVSLAYYLPGAKIWAVDISAEALAVARHNALWHKVHERICFLQGDLFAPLPPQIKYDLIVSNPPYISEEEYNELPTDVKKEPALALKGGADGLYFYRQIAGTASALLKDHGYLLVEIGWRQGPDVVRLFEQNDFREVRLIKDFGGRDRGVIGEKK
ncbi:MAG: peptide chain release factor N(5)-glutamine methyltransferase [Bacillota bacterium]